MIRFSTSILFLICINSAFGQSIQWADTVLDYSSELSPVLYSANQALGEPDVAEGEGDSPNAWAASKPNKLEYLVLGFKTPMRAQQIAVHESFNPGAITKILAIDENDESHLIYEREPRQHPRVSRVLKLFFPLTPYNVKAVEIQINGAAVEGINSIDAVALSGSNNPVQTAIPVIENINPDMETTRLGENVNSRYDEVGPVLSPDGRTLFFSRFNHPENIGGIEDDEDIWYSELDPLTGEWSPAQNIGSPLNNEEANYVNSASTNGDYIDLLLGNEYQKKGKVRPGLSISNNESGEWSFPVPFPVDQFYNLATNSEFMLSVDQQILLMSIEQEDSRGLVDIYVSLKDSTGTWSVPVNLGPTINTAHEELSPMLLADNRTLYFASAGFGGYGGTDILVSERLDDSWQNWTKPKNMGPAVNTSGDEVHMSIHLESEMGFFAREVNGNTDIFQFDKNDMFIPPKTSVIVELSALDAKTKKPLPTSFRVERETSRSQYSEIVSTRPQQRYSIELKLGETFKIVASAPGYYSETMMVNLKGDDISTEDRSFELQLQPEPPKVVTESAVVRDIQFRHNSSYMDEPSAMEVIALSKVINKNQIKTIELSGHTDNSGDEAYNLWLSERRTRRIAAMFVRYGVDENLLQLKWFGESLPKYSNDNAEDRNRNRRVEIRIIK